MGREPSGPIPGTSLAPLTEAAEPARHAADGSDGMAQCHQPQIGRPRILCFRGQISCQHGWWQQRVTRRNGRARRRCIIAGQGRVCWHSTTLAGTDEYGFRGPADPPFTGSIPVAALSDEPPLTCLTGVRRTLRPPAFPTMLMIPGSRRPRAWPRCPLQRQILGVVGRLSEAARIALAGGGALRRQLRW